MNGQEDLDEEFPAGDGTADVTAMVYCPYCNETVEISLDPGSGATQEYVRYRQNKPNAGRGVEGDLAKWDPVVDEALKDRMLRAQQELRKANYDLGAAREATARVK